MIKSTSLSVIATMLLTSQMANANQINSVQQSSSIIDNSQQVNTSRIDINHKLLSTQIGENSVNNSLSAIKVKSMLLAQNKADIVNMPN